MEQILENTMHILAWILIISLFLGQIIPMAIVGVTMFTIKTIYEGVLA